MDQQHVRDKYLPQVEYALRILRGSTAAVIRFDTLLATPGAVCLRDVLRPALKDQEGEMLNCQTALLILEELQTQADLETLRQRKPPSPPPSPCRQQPQLSSGQLPGDVLHQLQQQEHQPHQHLQQQQQVQHAAWSAQVGGSSAPVGPPATVVAKARPVVTDGRATGPFKFIRRQRRRLLPGDAPVAVADEAFLAACQERKIDLANPSTWPADRWRVCVLFLDHRDRYISVVYAVLKFVDFWLDIASNMGTVEAIAAALDYIEGTTFHEYAFGQLTLPAYRRKNRSKWTRVGLPCVNVQVPVEAGNYTALKIQWATTLLRAAAHIKGIPLPPKLWYQFNGDWISLLRDAAREAGAHLFNDLDHLYRQIQGRGDISRERAWIVMKYCFILAYFPRALEFSAFWVVKVDRMKRAWNVPTFVRWFTGHCILPMPRGTLERRPQQLAVGGARPAAGAVAAAAPAPRPRANGWAARFWMGLESNARKGVPCSEKLAEGCWSRLKYALASLGPRPKEIEVLLTYEAQCRAWCEVRGGRQPLIDLEAEYAIAPLPVTSPSDDLLRGKGRQYKRFELSENGASKAAMLNSHSTIGS